MITGKRILLSLALLFSASVSIAQKSPASETDLKKQAGKLFESENYQEAVTMYSQLLSLYPRDPQYNYRYGVCLIMSGQDKTGAASYLQVAARDQSTDPDVHFYLGRSYMFIDRFNEAIGEFEQFKKLGTSSKQAKLGVDRYIQNCNNANILRMDRKNVVVLSKSKVNRAAFFAAYDFTDAAGKLLTTPDRFLSPIDKAKMPNPVMFMTRDGETIYFASYGKKGDNGKDLYKTVKLPDGSWTEPSNLGGTVNTNADEDYPYLDKDGRTLYFSSTGHNSIGGYDVFKTQYDFNSGRWNEVVNVGMPVNTVDDDLFFVPSTKGETAAYATAVETENGRIEYRNLGLGKTGGNLAVISGQYLSEDQVTRRDARITVIRNRDNGVVTSVKTDKTGQYELVLPTGEDYMLVVEGGSYLPHAENFSVPSGQSVPGMHQKVVLNRTTDSEVLTMSNYFTPSAIDSSIASLEKPSQVTKSEFDMKDTATSKMQSITFEGRTLFVAPPSLPSPGLKSIDTEGLAVEEKTETPGVKETEQPAATSENADVQATPEAEKINGAVAAVPVANEKTSSDELVRMAFDDAITVKEEAAGLREEAIEKRLEARTLDSLSKEQIKQANQLITSGDAELSKEVFRQSQENVIASQSKINEAKSLDAAAHEKDLEYEASYKEAVQLMKEFKVDTNATAYQAIAIKEREQEKEANDEPASEVILNAHDVRSKQLAAEADSLFNESKYVEEQAIASSDKKQKAFLNEKAKELNEQGESRLAESRLESGRAEKERTLSLATAESASKETETTVQAESQKNQPVQSATDVSTQEKNNESAPAEKTTGNTTATGNQAETKSSVPVNNTSGAPVTPAENSNVVPGLAAAGPDAAVKDLSTSEGLPVKKLGPVPNVDPAAQQHFESYSEQLYESKKMEAASRETEAKLMNTNSPETRDSLEAKTIELNKESIKLWQNSSKELAMAKEIDPQIETKMAAAQQASSTEEEHVVAANKNQENRNASVPAVTDPISGNTAPASSEEKTSPAVNVPSAGTGPVSEQRESSTAGTENKSSQGEDVSTPAIAENKSLPGATENKTSQPEINSAAQTETTSTSAENNAAQGATEKSAAPDEMNTATRNSGEPAAAAEVLDTTKPAYAEYKETQQAIVEKQTETVNLFVEGMQLSKKAAAIRKEEMKIRDEAVVNTNKKEKARLEERADSLAMEAQILTDRSNGMLTAAQKNTGDVKNLTAKSDKIKSGLIVQTPVQESTPATAVEAAKIDKSVPASESAGTAVTETTSSDSAIAMKQSAPGNMDSVKTHSENITPSGQQEISTPEQGVTAENKSGEKNGAQEVQIDTTQPSVPAVSVPVVTESKSETAPISSAEETKQAETKTENVSTPTGDPSTLAKDPAMDEEPSVTSNESVTESSPAEGQTRVEKELSAPAEAPSKLVFEQETSDATTFSLAKANSVSESNTIPMDPVLPEGLVFKVQIGAFRKPLPGNAFNNLQPLSGETTRPGWIRYCLGLFRTFEPANLLKKEVRAMGYKDAFVVAYYNGKRIPLYDAYAMISKANAADKQTYATVTSNEFKQLEKFEIKKSSYDLKPDEDTKAFYGTTENVPADLVEYAVQVGVYKTSRTPSALSALLPLNTEQMSSGLYRFTTGRFDNRASADSMKRIAVNSGIRDAFIVIYKGGRKAGQREAQQIMNTARREAAAANRPTTTPAVEIPATPATNETVSPSDVIFKIQIGAFRENVPFNTVTSFLSIADKGITQETDARGLHIFYAGQYNNYDEALVARSEISAKGVKDAFIVAFVKGKRTSAMDALKLLNRN